VCIEVFGLVDRGELGLLAAPRQGFLPEAARRRGVLPLGPFRPVSSLPRQMAAVAFVWRDPLRAPAGSVTDPLCKLDHFTNKSLD